MTANSTANPTAPRNSLLPLELSASSFRPLSVSVDHGLETKVYNNTRLHTSPTRGFFFLSHLDSPLTTRTLERGSKTNPKHLVAASKPTPIIGLLRLEGSRSSSVTRPKELPYCCYFYDIGRLELPHWGCSSSPFCNAGPLGSPSYLFGVSL
ncbi:hypothetical protein BDW59DRAFT_95613 [Aspergillus cavernicola]|uniref:Uncharacterized protein n=1 Tax=Aspergillus cavernicola TaxID=176166 RepID=A0ABR4I7E8_9EURO